MTIRVCEVRDAVACAAIARDVAPHDRLDAQVGTLGVAAIAILFADHANGRAANDSLGRSARTDYLRER